MDDLTFKLDQSEYGKIMAHRIQYYSEKYDPHTVFENPGTDEQENAENETSRGFRLAKLHKSLLNIL